MYVHFHCTCTEIFTVMENNITVVVIVVVQEWLKKAAHVKINFTKH